MVIILTLMLPSILKLSSRTRPQLFLTRKLQISLSEKVITSLPHSCHPVRLRLLLDYLLGLYPHCQNMIGTEVVWGVNLRDLNMTAASLEANAIAEAFSSSTFKTAGVNLEAIEIGNEANLYPFSDWTVEEYVKV